MIKATTRRDFLKLAALVTGSAAVLAACSQASSGGSGISLKIGLVLPLTGEVKTFGESTKNGAELALADAKDMGINVTTVVADDKGDPTESVNATTKFINQDKVNVIIGSVTSKATIADSEVANASKVVLVTPTSTNPKVTVADGKRKEYVFRSCFIDPFQGTVMAKFALDTLKAKKAAVLYDISNDYTKGLAEFFRDAFTKGGGQVASFETYGQNDVDFSALLTKVAAASPDFLFLPDYYNKVNLIAKQAREKGIKAPMGGGDGWDSPELDTKATDGGYFSNHYSPEDKRPEVAEWVAKYKAKFNAVPDALATLGYDAGKLVLAAVKQAGSSDPTKIKDALAGTKGFKGVSGTITFDANGDPVKSAAIVQIKDGKQVFVATVNP